MSESITPRLWLFLRCKSETRSRVSNANSPRLMSSSLPSISSACPNRAVRVGYTQSNMSTPRDTSTIKSSAYPTPIFKTTEWKWLKSWRKIFQNTYRKDLTQYLGLLTGKSGAELSITLQNSSLVSPPLKPPIANPGAFLLVISSEHLIRGSGSRPPWIIGKIFWLTPNDDSRQRSSHLLTGFSNFQTVKY